MRIQGKFEVKVQFEPPYETVDGVTHGRAKVDKRFFGELDATSQVHMLASRTPVENSGAYVALECIQGTVSGKRGSFTVTHVGVMNRGAQSLTITIVPDSGTGELTGISGAIAIQITEGQHDYTLDYDLL
jgi:hypothetical protein